MHISIISDDYPFPYDNSVVSYYRVPKQNTGISSAVRSVTKISVQVSQKKPGISFKKSTTNGTARLTQFHTDAVPLLVEFLKNIDFQRRYDAFSETTLQIMLLHQVCRYLIHYLWEDGKADSVYTQDGTKCGDGKVCSNFNCVDKSSFTNTPSMQAICGNGIVESGEECDCGASVTGCGCCDTCMFVSAGSSCMYNECGRCTGSDSSCTDVSSNLMFKFLSVIKHEIKQFGGVHRILTGVSGWCIKF